MSFVLLAGSLRAQQAYDSHRPDAHAPIGVMGDHVHESGEWMFSFRIMEMRMDGLRDGTSSVTPAQVLSQYMATPTSMDMTMAMLGAMYAPSDDLTLMVMLPYLYNSMDHLTRMGREFTTRSRGLGDVRVAGLVPIFEEDGRRAHVTVGMNLPTGSITARDDTPMGPDQLLPYPMQLGSGTFDPVLGATWWDQHPSWSWGAQATAIFRLYDNRRDYHRGQEANATIWAALPVAEWLSLSGRLDGRWWGNYHGADPALNPAVIPTADPNLRGGRRVDAGFGFNFLGPDGDLHGQRLALEVLFPVYQYLDGPQLETDFTVVLGWQYAF